MNTCILITSHLNESYKEQIALELLDFLSDKNLPIIFVGNYPLSQKIQSKSDYILYVKENPKTLFNRQLFFNGKNVNDYGYAHLHQIGKGFLLCQSLGFEYIHHLNYDITFTEENFTKLIEKGKLGEPIVYSWGPSAFATNLFSIKSQDYLNSIEKDLHFYQNENPPNISGGWFCEVFFKWALNRNNLNPSITTDIEFHTAINSW